MNELTWVDLIAASTPQSVEISVSALFFEATGVVLAVLLLLMAASIGTWFIIGYKWWVLHRAEGESRKFSETFWASKRMDSIQQRAEDLPNAPIAAMFSTGYAELRKLRTAASDGEATMRAQLGGIENIERALRSTMLTEISKMERLMPFLATVGSTSPFIGLFGTVWGIMIAFMAIAASGQAGLDVVSGPIAEALVATAIGLIAAIPAVMGYNFFNARIRKITVEMENFESDFLNIVKRHFFK